MEAIARDEGVSRSTISRMLKQARELGLVRITLEDPADTDRTLTQELTSRFGVRAQVINVSSNASEVNRLDHVAAAAAHLVDGAVTDGTVMGCAWGTTLASIVRHVEPRRRRDVKVIQINGGANARTSGIPFVGELIIGLARAYGGEAVLFPVPAFFDAASTREAMWRERSITPLLAAQRSLDVAVFGVGAFEGPLASHVYTGGYLDGTERQALIDDGVVGDVCTVFLRADGTWRDVELNTRATGLNPDELKRVGRRICAAAGRSKATAVLAALRAGVATDLVVDDLLAEAILDTQRLR